MADLDVLDDLLAEIVGEQDQPDRPVQVAAPVLPVVSSQTQPRSLSITGIREIPTEYGSNFRIWDDKTPWAGAKDSGNARAVFLDNFSLNTDPVAILSSEFSFKLGKERDSVRLWHEPGPRRLQQCIMEVCNDDAERTRAVSVGIVWVPLLNHRINGQVKGVVVHRQLNGLRNAMELCAEDMELLLINPKGSVYRQTKIPAESLLSPFTFDLDSSARTGTWKLKLVSGGHVFDQTEIEVLAFSKPEVMITDLSSSNVISAGVPSNVSVQAKYFFDEPLRCAKVNYSIIPDDPSVPSFKNIAPDWHSKDGIFTFPALCNHVGAYRWEITFTDSDGRSGSSVGSYRVENPSISLACTFSVQSNTAVAVDSSQHFSVIYPGSSTIAIDIAVVDHHNIPVPNCSFSVDMEGKDEFWKFVNPVPASTGESGRVTVQILFNAVSFDSEEPFVLLVSANHDKSRFVWRKVILVDPRNQYTLQFDKPSYVPGDEVIATVQLKRAGDNAPQVLALDVVGQTIWAASTLRFASNVSSMQYKFKAPETREPIYLHLRPHLDVTAARFRVPIQVPSFYTDKLSVSTPAKVATGSEIAVKVKLPQPAESDGVAVAVLVDKRIKKHPNCDNTQRWSNLFRVDPVEKQEAAFDFYEVTEWEHAKDAVRFQAMLCSVQWIGWAYLNPFQQGRVLIVSINDTSVLTPTRVQFLTSLLSPALQVHDAVEMLRHFPCAEQAALYTVGATVKTLSRGSIWAADGIIPPPAHTLRKTLKGQLSFLTNNLITTPPKNRNRPLKRHMLDRLQDAMEVANAMNKLACAARPYDDDYYQPTVVRQNFIEVATESIAFHKGAQDIEIRFAGSDAITTYDIYVFACCDSQIAYGKNATVVKNKYFTVTKNPAQMVLADLSIIRTIIQNVSDVPMENVALQLTLERLQCKLNSQIIPLVEPGGSASVSWEILATRVGEAKMELLMKTASGFTEISGFDTPLTIVPPGEPVVQKYSGLVDKASSWKMNFLFDSKAAHVKIVGSLLPCLAVSGAIEGVESLASYPYGCCEQMHSSTLPNLILYQYLQRTGSTNEDLKSKCLKQLATGCQRLVSSFRGDDGGFGAWSRSSTVFHTGLVLSLFGLASEVITIDKSLIDRARNYLINAMKRDGSFVPAAGAALHFPESKFDATSSTAHAFNCMCHVGYQSDKTLAWLKAHLLNKCEDTTAMALVLEGLTRLPAEQRSKYTLFIRNLRRLVLLEQQPNGSWVASNTALCSKVESTAYAIIALARSLAMERSAEITALNECETTDAIAKGLDYVLAHHKGRGGWRSTRDTLYAAWAVTEAGDIVWSRGIDSSYIVRLNGTVVHKWTLKTDKTMDDDTINTIHTMREFVLPSDLLKKDQSNEVVVECTNSRTSAAMEVSTYYHINQADAESALADAVGRKAALTIGKLTSTWSKKVLSRGHVAQLAVCLHPNDEYNGVMLEIPIPAGMLLPSLDSVGVSESKITKEWNEKLKTVSIFFHTISSGHVISVDLKLEPFIVGKVTANPCRAFLMYDPDVMCVSPSTQLAIVDETK